MYFQFEALKSQIRKVSCIIWVWFLPPCIWCYASDQSQDGNILPTLLQPSQSGACSIRNFFKYVGKLTSRQLPSDVMLWGSTKLSDMAMKMWLPEIGMGSCCHNTRVTVASWTNLFILDAHCDGHWRDSAWRWWYARVPAIWRHQANIWGLQQNLMINKG